MFKNIGKLPALEGVQTQQTPVTESFSGPYIDLLMAVDLEDSRRRQDTVSALENLSSAIEQCRDMDTVKLLLRLANDENGLSAVVSAVPSLESLSSANISVEAIVSGLSLAKEAVVAGAVEDSKHTVEKLGHIVGGIAAAILVANSTMKLVTEDDFDTSDMHQLLVDNPEVDLPEWVDMHLICQGLHTPFMDDLRELAAYQMPSRGDREAKKHLNEKILSIMSGYHDLFLDAEANWLGLHPHIRYLSLPRYRENTIRNLGYRDNSLKVLRDSVFHAETYLRQNQHPAERLIKTVGDSWFGSAGRVDMFAASDLASTMGHILRGYIRATKFASDVCRKLNDYVSDVHDDPSDGE